MLTRNARRTQAPDLVRRLLLAWLTAVTLEYFRLPQALRTLGALDGLAEMSLPRVLLTALAGTAALWVLSRFLDTARAERWGLGAVFGALAAGTLAASFTWPFLGACLLVEALLVHYARRGWESGCAPLPRPEPGRLWLWITLGLSALFFLFVCAWTVARVWSFSTPTYDFGIFSQMFYSMKETGLPVTTVERDGALSHFAVHVSPIYYLLLPFYCLVPRPAALQVLQAAVITSAVIPLWKLAGRHGLSGPQRALVCGLLLLFPAFSGGTSYDIHENCFLTPLLLWLFYGIDTGRLPVTIVSALLTLMVKEDAAVYVAVAGLWLILRGTLRPDRKDLLTGLGLLAGSLAWFAGATGYLSSQGDGVMTYRYKNFIYDGSASLATVVKAVILNPMKAVYECVDSEKLRFLALTMAPLLGLPLATRRYERYVLLIPYVLVNLMSDYQYQHDIFFQYTFGSTAFLLYLTVVNLTDIRGSSRRLLALVLAAAVSGGCFGAVVVPKAVWYPTKYLQNASQYETVREALSRIPEDASVAATTFYTTSLSQREILYDVRYSSQAHLLETEYVVLSTTAEADYKKFASAGKDNGLENLLKLLADNGYEVFAEVEDTLVIFRKVP